MTRVATAIVLLASALAANFLLSGAGFVLFALALVEVAAIEYALLASRIAGRRVMWALPILVPIALLLLLRAGPFGQMSTADNLLLLAFVVGVLASLVALFSRVSLEETVAAAGLLSFGIPYFAAPVAALVRLHAQDAFLVILVVAIVLATDTAAYYIGSAFGRHKLAPIVSPNKSWEGAVAGLIGAVVAAALWSGLRLGSVDPGLLAVAAVTSIAGQAGDLVESTLKRRVGVKDSSALLPGHGGMLDRLDSLLFATPTLALSLVAIGWELP